MSQRDFDFAIGTGDEFYGPANFARGGLGANIPQGRGCIRLAFVHAEGRPLNGANKYILHFEKGQPPRANALWLVTLSDEYGS